MDTGDWEMLSQEEIDALLRSLGDDFSDRPDGEGPQAGEREAARELAGAVLRAVAGALGRPGEFPPPEPEPLDGRSARQGEGAPGYWLELRWQSPAPGRAWLGLAQAPAGSEELVRAIGEVLRERLGVGEELEARPEPPGESAELLAARYEGMGWYIPPEVVRDRGAPGEGENGGAGGASTGAGAEAAAAAEPVVRAAGPGGGEQPAVETPAFRPFQAAPVGTPQGGGTIDLLLDVPLQLTVELGQTQRTVREILELAPGTVVELDRLAGEPVDLLVNGRLIARGEVVVIDENFGIRITDIVSPGERLRRLR